MAKKIIVIGLLGLAIFCGSAAVGISMRQGPQFPVEGQALEENLAQGPSLETMLPEEASSSQEPSNGAPVQAQPEKKQTVPAKNITPAKTGEEPKKESPAEEGESLTSQETINSTGQSNAKDSEAEQNPWQGRVEISGSAPFSDKVRESLNLLAEKAPSYAKKVTTYLTEIRESDHSGVEVQTGVFHLGKNTVNTQDAYWLASVIVHDAYHAELYRKGQEYVGEEAEAMCIEEQKDVLLAMGAPASYQTHLNQVLESNYWNVPFEDRNW